MKWIISGIVLCILWCSSCTKNDWQGTEGNFLRSSADTLHFDTVFTTTGSITKFIKLYNPLNKKIQVSAIELMGGTQSSFYMNVDGSAGNAFHNIEIEGNDSLYVFVAVRINPTQQYLPFVVQDSIRVQYNGNDQWIQLQAYGQNARFHQTYVVHGQETWTKEKPHVILGSLVVAAGSTLTIQKGCRIYTHANAPLIVYGNMIVQGALHDTDRVVFQGDRLDLPYSDYPAAWPGIYFKAGSINNTIRYAQIKNAYQGIVCEGDASSASMKLSLKESSIENCYDAGIIGIQTKIDAQNVLVKNCGKNITLAYGGNYTFTHCTSVAFSNAYIAHKDPSVILTDYYKDNGTLLTANMNGVFTNCIFWGGNGSTDNEVVTDKQGSRSFSILFDHCLMKYKIAPANVSSLAPIANQDPLFDSIDHTHRVYDLHLKSNSPALNKGVPTGVILDLDGKARSSIVPDLGCYEQ